MKKILFSGASLLLLCAAFTACSDNDPKYEEVKPRQVDVAPTTLSGIVTDMAGNPVEGATVAIGDATATTGADGSYALTVPELGDQSVVISGPGMLPSSFDIYFEASADMSRHYTLSTRLAREVKQAVSVSSGEGGEGTVTSEAIPSNDRAEIPITVDVEPNTFAEDVVITITPIYTEESAKILARADNDKMLLGANITSSKPSLELAKPIDVKFRVDQTVTDHVVTRQLIDGTWTDVPHTAEGGELVVAVTEFAPVGLFFPVTVTESSTLEELSFTPDSWDNLFGSAEEKALTADYNYGVGGTFDASGDNTLQALLVEELARIIGAKGTTQKASYPINTEVLVGTAYEISGDQETTKVTVKSGSESATGTRYGTVYIRVLSFYRDHNGGVVSAD